MDWMTLSTKNYKLSKTIDDTSLCEILSLEFTKKVVSDAVQRSETKMKPK